MSRKISILLLITALAWLTTLHVAGKGTKKEDVKESYVIETITAEVTAYTSSADETDDTPEITANGSHAGEGTIACPRRYAFGTQVEVEGRRYVCEDRMNIRYANRFDIWMASKEEAREWGVRTLQVNILK